MYKAIIIGNGGSRKGFPISCLKIVNKIQTYGCNAIYRDFPKVDWLIAIDEKIIREIDNSNFPKHKFIVPPLKEQFEPIEFNPYQSRSNAGMNAMIEAIRHGNKTLYCLGFDFLIADKTYCTSNIYEGTNSYGPETHTSFEDSIRRVKYLEWFCNKHSDIEFIFVYPNDVQVFFKLKSKNIKKITFDEFIKEIGLC